MRLFRKAPTWNEVYKGLIEDIKREEGFMGFQYEDHLGKKTIGFGTLLPLAEEEAELLLKYRLEKFVKNLIKEKPIVETLPIEARLIILQMAYQMGVQGVLGFKKMWQSIERGDYHMAAIEMGDSKWANQTPQRAQRLAARMKSIGFEV